MNFGKQWPATLHRDRHSSARHWLAVLRGEEARGIRHLQDSGIDHLEASDLIGWAKTVLGRAYHPKTGVAITFKCEHNIDEMFQQPGTSNGPVLGYVPDDDHCHPA
jgi:hypothetical protein